MTVDRDINLKKLAAALGVDIYDTIVAVPHNEITVEYDGLMYVSGQIPRVRGAVAVVGRVGAEVSLEEGRRAARVCIVRALAAVRQSGGTLDRVRRVLRMNVHVQSAPNFTEHSEVADAASDIVNELLGADGGHTRTTTGAYQLPRNAAVEIDLLVALSDRDSQGSTF
jgi:enamine deaminase RidA (YjgF/YER057c/UK114 family)